MKPLERDLARRVTAWLRSRGCVAIKLSTLTRYGTPGWPDYLVLQHRGTAWFVELKTGTGRLTPLQAERRKTLEALGFSVFVVRSREELERAWKVMQRG